VLRCTGRLAEQPTSSTTQLLAQERQSQETRPCCRAGELFLYPADCRGTLRLEHLYAASAIRGVALAFFMPALGAIMPEVVPTELLQQGNALRGLSRQAGRLLGPALGGAMVATAGAGAAIGADALTFLVSFAFLLAAGRLPSRVAAARSRLVDEARAGLAFVCSLPWLWITIFGFAVINVGFSGSVSIALPVLLADPRDFGLLVGAMGVGEGLGGLLVGQRRYERLGVPMYLFNALAGLALAAVALSDGLPRLAAGAGFGLGFVGFGVLWETAVQRHVPAALLGRVTSVDHFGAILLNPVGPFVIGAVVETSAPALVVLWSGVGISLLSLAALAVPSIRRL